MSKRSTLMDVKILDIALFFVMVFIIIFTIVANDVHMRSDKFVDHPVVQFIAKPVHSVHYIRGKAYVVAYDGTMFKTTKERGELAAKVGCITAPITEWK